MSNIGSVFASYGSGAINPSFLPDLWSSTRRVDFGYPTTVTVTGPVAFSYFCPECQNAHVMKTVSTPCETISPDKAARLSAFFDIKDDSQF